MNLQAVIPIFIPSGDSGPMSEHDSKLMLSIWVIINTLWLISWMCTGIRYLIYLKKNKSGKRDWHTRWLDYFDETALFLIWDVIMAFIWAVILLCVAGEFLMKFI